MKIRTVSVGSPKTLMVGSLVGLTVGLFLGFVAHETGNPALLWLGEAVRPIGEGWTAALLMIVIPLVSSYLFVSIAGHGDTGAVARVGGLSVALFVGFLLLAAVLTVSVVPTLLDRAPLDPGAFTALAAGTAVDQTVAAAPRNPLAWFVGLIPSNPFEALAEGQILSILIFVVLFALAATRLPDESRDLLVRIGAAVAEMSMTLVRWLLIPLPLAVFALAFPMAIETGGSVVGAVVWYVAVVCALLLSFTAIVYGITWAAGGIPPLRFQRGITDAQLVAIGTRSSLASLPAMLVGARERLDLDEDVSNLVLPLAVSAFKVNRTITSPFKLLFLAHMYGLVVAPEYLVIYIGTLVLLSFATPGLPSRSTFGVMLPFYMAAGIPVEGVVLMSAVDAIPDVFKTLLNVTADLSVTAIVARVFGDAAAGQATGPLASAQPAIPGAPGL